MSTAGISITADPWRYGIVLLAVTTAAFGDRPLVDAVVVLGIGLLAPLALGRPGWWPVAALSASIGLVVDERLTATALVLPAMAVAVGTLAVTTRSLLAERRTSPSPWSLSMQDVALVLVPGWAVVGVASLLASTARVELFDIGEPIVRLTANHYLYAGVGALEIARRLHREPGRWHGLTTVGLVTTAVAPPVVAAGFVLDAAIPQIGGAVLMTVGVWSSAAVLLRRALLVSARPRRGLRIVAGVTPWVPMVLAVSWAAAQHLGGIPALSVPDMARVHGLANGIGFVLAGLVATTPTETAPSTAPPIAVAA